MNALWSCTVFLNDHQCEPELLSASVNVLIVAKIIFEQAREANLASVECK